MPLYGWRCPACGHKFEEILSLSEKSNTKAVMCQECQGLMDPEYGSFNINFRTWGGNTYGFSSNRPPKGNRRPVTIGRGHGIGGHRGRRNPTQADVSSGKAQVVSKLGGGH